MRSGNIKKKKKMKDTTKATLNFLYFSMNYPHGWEKKCFKGNDHIIDKYDDLQMPPMRFIFELSRNYQIQMLDWVQNNYSAFEDLKIIER